MTQAPKHINWLLEIEAAAIEQSINCRHMNDYRQGWRDLIESGDCVMNTQRCGHGRSSSQILAKGLDSNAGSGGVSRCRYQ
jgi:hypothetical protein